MRTRRTTSRLSTIMYFNNVQYAFLNVLEKLGKRGGGGRVQSQRTANFLGSGRGVDIYVSTKAYGIQEARRKFQGKHSQIVERVCSPFRKRDFVGNLVIGTYVLSRGTYTRGSNFLCASSPISRASEARFRFYRRSFYKCTINFEPRMNRASSPTESPVRIYGENFHFRPSDSL